MFSILFAYLNYKIRRIDDDKPDEAHGITDEERKDY